MLQLLQPIWLTAMAGIVFPVLLHLWNDRQGKLLQVGSVALLEKQWPKQTWSRRLSEWWLLVLRCLLLMALALLLAGPSWRKGPAGDGKKGWILVAGAGPGQDGGLGAERHFKPLIDSLLKAGYERHEWAEGENYWNAFRAMDRVAPGGVPFFIFSSARASRFGGSRPSTGRPVHWYTYTPMDSVVNWTGAAWLASPDSVRAAYGSSKPTGTSYSYQTVARRSLSTGELPSVLDTAVLRVIIYTDKDNVHDGRYLAAAIRSVEQFERRKIQLTITGSVPDSGTGKQDWLFWLSLQRVPVGVIAEHVLRYEPGRAIAVNTWVRGVEDGVIWKEVEAAGGAEAVWKDGYGRTLLGLERTEHGAVYHFFSRFDPGWNGLVWSRQWPVLLEKLLLNEDHLINRDLRTLDPKQVAPVKKGRQADERVAEGRHAGGVAMRADVGEALDLAPVCWILVVLLFILERVVAYGVAGRKK